MGAEQHKPHRQQFGFVRRFLLFCTRPAPFLESEGNEMTNATSELAGQASAARHRAWVREKKEEMTGESDVPESETREAEIEEMRRDE